MSGEIWIYAILFVMLGVMSIFLGIAAQRKRKGYKVTILRDLRNPSKKSQKFWGRYNASKDDAIKLYSNLFTPIKSRIIPPFDLSAYSFDGSVYCIQGVSGHPEDTNIVPVHIPIIGQASAMDFSQEVSGAIERTMQLMRSVEKHGEALKIGEIVEYDNKRYVIDSIGWQGIGLGYNVQAEVMLADKTTKIEERYQVMYISDTAQIAKLKVIGKNEKAVVPTLLNYFNGDWVMQTFGVVPVQDVNVVLESEKASVASFNSKINERVLSKQSWFTRNQVLVGMVIMIFVFAIALTIIAYAVSNSVNTLNQQTQAATSGFITKLLGIAGTHGLIPTVNTTINANAPVQAG